MNYSETKKLFSEIFQDIAPEIEFDKINTSLPLRDQVELDSFDFYRIVVELGKRSGVNIPNRDLAQMKNLDQLIRYVEKVSSEVPSHQAPFRENVSRNSAESSRDY